MLFPAIPGYATLFLPATTMSLRPNRHSTNPNDFDDLFAPDRSLMIDWENNCRVVALGQNIITSIPDDPIPFLLIDPFASQQAQYGYDTRHPV